MHKSIIAISSLIVVGGVVVTLAVLNYAGKPANGRNESVAGPQALAENWVKQKSPTYLYDGSNLMLDKLEKTNCETCYRVTLTFDSAHGGYGDRSDMVVTQVITPHTIVLDLKNAQVERAVTDGVFNEMTGKMLSEEGTQQMTVKVFFPNTEKDPEISCNEVFPVERTVPATTATAQAALQELLAGPTIDEVAEKYYTSIPEGVSVNSITIANGVATVDFSEELDKNVGGSCRVISIRSQIVETLKQFPTVTKVVISVNDEVEEALQP